jgi:DNA-directed RNA polymerase specialized sigma24 family protein
MAGYRADDLRLLYFARVSRWATLRMPRGSERQARELASEMFDDLTRNGVSYPSEAAFLLHLRREFLRRLEPSAGSRLAEAIGAPQLRRYDSALLRLDPADQAAIVARVEMGLSHREMADAIGAEDERAARTRVTTALLRLAEEMSRVAE